ncbi:hypothetical protein SapgrDRAFT_2968 [Saprospira grandis DSM 2844]|uniref:Lipoprotein n=1 Tax=Saprospira grandis DSM 2844 TaxID=694433 RepID=J0PAK0_9BACT|nr:hypothetical protein [Saprospira grandis]EJF54617.1 hypothetical protein SapgrDRAFT_2968 [Saprospira grandis DSM 2844]
MKTLVKISVLVLLVITVATCLFQPSQEEQQLLGNWGIEEDGARFCLQLNPNHQANFYFFYSNLFTGEFLMKVKMNWELTDGKLSLRFDKKDPPEIAVNSALMNTAMRMKINEMRDDFLKGLEEDFATDQPYEITEEGDLMIGGGEALRPYSQANVDLLEDFLKEHK